MTKEIKTPEEREEERFNKILEIKKCGNTCFWFSEANSFRNYSTCTNFYEPKIIEESENTFPSFCPLRNQNETFTLKQIHSAYEKTFSHLVGADYWNNYWKMVEFLLNER